MPDLKFERLNMTRIVALPAALDVGKLEDALVFRTAPDEVLVMAEVSADSIDDEHAIVVSEGGFAGAWLAIDDALAFLERECEWQLPIARPTFVQGAVAGIATKLYFEQDRVLFMIPAPFVVDFEERFSRVAT